MSSYSPSDLILITCASGKQGTDLVPALYAKHTNLRLQVHSTASQSRFQAQYPKAEVVTADLSNPLVPATLLKNVTAAYFIHLAFGPHEFTQAQRFIDACLTSHRAGGFKHLVYSSVLHPIISSMQNHDAKRLVEEYVLETGLPSTVLQPSHLMESVPLSRLMQQETPVHPMPYSPDTVFTWTSTRDLAEIGVKVLLEREAHLAATYEIVSTEPGSYRDAVVRMGEAIGKEVRIERVPVEVAAEKVVLGDRERVEGARRMLGYYDFRGLVGNRNVARWLLGREPLGYREWLAMKVEEIRDEGQK